MPKPPAFRPSLADVCAFLLSLLAVFAALWVHDRVFERMAHLEDEMAYVWQAQVMAAGHVTIPSPPFPRSFLVPFVVDYQGQRFGKYPLGWPALLAVGEKFGVRYLVNPLLAGLGVWLTYRLGKRLLGSTVGLLAALLTLTSPFFLIVSGSLLSHPMGLVFSAAFALCWLEAFATPQSKLPAWLPLVSGAGALGVLALSRPYTALGVALPFAFHGLVLLWRGDKVIRLRLFLFGMLVALIAGLHFLWQWVATGDPFLNPYTLWWPYDKVGFGPGYGRLEGGHTLKIGWINTRHSLYVGAHDLFGWAAYSWIFLPFGLVALLKERNWRALLAVGVFPSLVLLYVAYWVGAALFGPRYYYEGLYSLTLLSATGIAWLAGWPLRPEQPFPNYAGWRSLRPLGMTALLTILLLANVLFYLPFRLQKMYGLYDIRRSKLAILQTPQAQQLAPGLIIVHIHKSWVEYGTLLELQDPFLTTPFIVALSRGPVVDAQLAQSVTDRRVYHYYPATDPYTLHLVVQEGAPPAEQSP